jgi:ATP-dependent RNA circularization protein (DNA/RNA ligase family)
MIQDRTKYPRTFHLSFSEALQNDDKLIDSLDKFEGQEVVVTIKMDGENTSLYPDGYLHARSIDSKTNWTRDIAKKILSVIRNDIPDGYRLCCENVYAKHSIHYPDNYLEGYLYLLSIWNDKNECLSWDDTLEYAELLDLPTPQILYKGIFDEKKIKELVKTLDTELQEGFVVRLTRKIEFNEFSECFTKYVRAGHVQDDAEHWLKNAIPNGIPIQPTKPAFMSQAIKRKKIF